MSERKVLQKYYPPDFDPRELLRRRGPKSEGPRIQTVRLMAPFNLRCLTCGEFIYRGRKFNARKETNLEHKYLNIQIYLFHIKCTRCSAEIIFRTDPKNNDYAMVKGAVRNMEPWRNREAEEESVDARLDRLEREEAEAAGEEEKNAMADLEAKNADARREMAAADMLDEIRRRNARIHMSEKEGTDYTDMVVRSEDEERARQDREDAEAAKRAFAHLGARREARVANVEGESSSSGFVVPRKPVVVEEFESRQPDSVTEKASLDRESASDTTNNAEDVTQPEASSAATMQSFKRVVKRKKDHSTLLGIKRKKVLV